MKPTRRRAKAKAAKSPKRPQLRRGKSKFITRAEARRRAERFVLNRIFNGAVVMDGAAVRLGIYQGGTRWRNRDVWVVYKGMTEPAIKSSEVVLVCKRTGRVLYEGSAGDEG